MSKVAGKGGQNPAGEAKAGRAKANPLQSLCEESTCPICLGYFQEPVMTDCGHVFCQGCLTQHWEKGEAAGGGGGEGGEGEGLACPQCRAPGQKASLRPVRPLAAIAQVARSLSGSGLLPVAAGKMCQDHQEPLKLFCQEDRALLCVVCDRSREHREHKVVPKKEAFEEHKKIIWDYLEFLKNERRKILSCKKKKENENQYLLNELEKERKKIVAEFKKLHEFLGKNEEVLLTRQKNLDSKIKDVRNKIAAKLSEEISSVDRLIKDMEKHHMKPEDEFLQDIKSVLQRCDRGKFVEPETSFPELRNGIQWISGTYSFLDHIMKKFQDYAVWS